RRSSDLETLHAALTLGTVYIGAGEFAKAEPLINRALELTLKNRGNDHPSLPIFLNETAKLHQLQGDWARAEADYLRSIEIASRSLAPDDHHALTALNNLAVLYNGRKLYDRAELLLRRVLDIEQASHGPNSPRLAL